MNDVPRGITGDGPAYVIFPTEIGNIEGRVLTVLESLGLPPTQEKAAKDLLRKSIWENIYNPYRLFVLPDEIDVLVKSNNARKGPQNVSYSWSPKGIKLKRSKK